MNFENILNLVIAIAPSLVSILGIILSLVKMLGTFKHETKQQTEDIAELKKFTNQVLQENRKLESQLKELISNTAPVPHHKNRTCNLHQTEIMYSHPYLTPQYNYLNYT